MKKILPLSVLAFCFIFSVSFAAENTVQNSASTWVLNNQIEVVDSKETDLVTENKNTLEATDNKNVNDEENDNKWEWDRYEKNSHEDNEDKNIDEEDNDKNHDEGHHNEKDDDEQEIILILVGILSGLLGLAFGTAGTIFYLRKKNNK